jgi:Flp pilus assembly protein TadD
MALIVVVGLGIAWLGHSRIASVSAPPANSGGRGPLNPEAVDLYLKGRFEWSKRSPESLTKAVDFFTQAIVRDPNYAQAYAGLADTYNLMREYTAMPSNEAYPRAIAAARKAVELDDSLSEAHRALAFATFYWTWDFAAGEREFKRAIELNPKDAVAHHWYGTAMGGLGRYTEALSQLEQARQLDPGSPSIQSDRALFLCYSGRDEEGISLLKQIELTDPNFISPHRYMAFLAILKGDYASYLSESRKSADLSHDQSGLEVVKAAEKGFAAGGGTKLLESIRHVQETNYDQGLISGIYVAETCAMSGKNQEAMHYLQEMLGKHDPAIVDILSDPAFRSLHDDPSFRDLVRRVGLPPL